MARLGALAGMLLAVVWFAPATALERLAKPDAGAPAVTLVADLDTRAHAPMFRHRRDVRWHWRYRAAYTRWLHNEYVRAGYPVEHRQFRTYVRVVPCCCCGDPWRR